MPAASLPLERSESRMTILMFCAAGAACAASFVLGHAHAIWQRHRFVQSLLSGRDTAAYSAVVLDDAGNVL